jgi:ribosomal protein S18 acetylase RimI-like enzyme
MVATLADLNHELGALSAVHLDRVVAIDRAHTGHARRRFFEKRFAAAQARPEDFIMLGVMRGGALRGFAIARVLHGEFGREEDVAVLDAVGVETESQDRGIGHTLMDELVAALRQKGMRSLQSQARWVNYDLLRFFEASGFELAPRFILERSVSDRLSEEIDEP